MSERRGTERHQVWLGAEIRPGAGRVHEALTSNGHAGGLLVLTGAKLAVGDAVTLRVWLSGAEARRVEGRVVRFEEMSADENALWSSKVAIALDPPDPELGERLRALAERRSRP